MEFVGQAFVVDAEQVRQHSLPDSSYLFLYPIKWELLFAALLFATGILGRGGDTRLIHQLTEGLTP